MDKSFCASIAPPFSDAEFLSNVESVTSIYPSAWIAPPFLALLSSNRQLNIDMECMEFSMVIAPPLSIAVLFRNMESIIFA